MHRRVQGILHLPFDLLRADRQIVDGAFAYFPTVLVRKIPEHRHEMPERGDQVNTCGAVNMAVSIGAASRVSAQTVDQSDGLGPHDKAQILTRSPSWLSASPCLTRSSLIGWEGLFGMEEFLSRDFEAERLVVRQQRGMQSM